MCHALTRFFKTENLGKILRIWDGKFYSQWKPKQNDPFNVSLKTNKNKNKQKQKQTNTDTVRNFLCLKGDLGGNVPVETGP